MPGYKTHLVGGLVSFVVTFAIAYSFKQFAVSFPTALGWFFMCLFGALFPDIDVKSKGQGFIYPILLFILLLFLRAGNMVAFTLLSIASLIPLVANHRGLFHNYLFIVGCAVIGALCIGQFFFSSTLYLASVGFFCVGAGSHLFLDRYTVAK